MADNVPITAGVGTTIATDDVGGAQYQVIKVALGADGAVDMHLDSGQQTMANSLPVTLASNQTAVPVLDTNSAAALTALQLIDNAISGAGFNITQQNGVAVSLNTGVRDTGTQRVTIATNDSVPVTFTGSTDVATQTSLALAVTALQLIDNAISGAGFNITQFNGEAIDVGAGTEAAALRVTLPNNGTGILAGVTTVTTVTTVSALTTLTGGGVADNAADSGNPIKMGGKYAASAPTLDDGDRGNLYLDVNGNLKITQATLLAGEDLTNNKMVVEHQYSYSRKTADGQVKGSAGFVHTITIAPTTATPTAGLITVYDSLTETGTIIFSEWIFAITPGHTVTLDFACATGIYVGYTTVTDVSVSVSYR